MPTQTREAKSSEQAQGISLNGAPSQYGRWLESAGAQSVEVDGRSLPELLNFAVPYGELLKFYNLSDHPAGNWQPFFLTDPTMLLAALASLNLQSIESRIAGLDASTRKSFDPKSRTAHLSAYIQALVALARQLDSVLGVANVHHASRTSRLLAGHLNTWIGSSLSMRLRQLRACAEEAGLQGAASAAQAPDFTAFSQVWNPAKASVPPGPPACCDETPRQWLERILARLEMVFRAFIEALRQLREFALKHLPATLLEADHKPQIALYIAFVHLFQIAQRSLNILTGRFSQFYYRELLRATNAALIPDSIYLTLSLDPAAGVAATTVPAGTQFPGGKEKDGSVILYASDRDVAVSAAALAVVRPLRLVSGPLYTAIASPPGVTTANVTAAQYLTGTEIDVSVVNAEAQGKLLPGGLVPWQPFGQASPGSDAISTTAIATLGFAIASDYLMLTGGERSVQLTFHLSQKAQQDLETALADMGAALGLPPDAVLTQVIDQAFDLYLSTTDGWFAVTNYSSCAWPCASPPGPAVLSLSLVLAPSAPPVVAFNPPPDEKPATPPFPDNLNPAPLLPTLKAYLRQTPITLQGTRGQILTYALSLLSKMEVEWIEIRTQTANLAILSIDNTTGPVDTTSPFPTFGGTAVPGSFIQFRNQELFVKRPEDGSLRIDLAWFGLPPNDTGFAGYYHDYVLGLDGLKSPTVLFDNQTFRGNLDVIEPGLWNIQPTVPDTVASPPSGSGLYLFRSQDWCASHVPAPALPLCTVTSFADISVTETEAPRFYDPSQSAIRLTFSEPPYGFGDSLYASNVLNAVIADLPQIDKGTLSPACQPLSDAADSLTALIEKLRGSADSPTTSAESGPGSQAEAAVKQIEEQLIKDAKNYLLQTLAPDGQCVTAWIQTTFTVSGSKVPAYRAQTIRGRLQAALNALGSPERALSPPALPDSAADPLRRALVMLQAAIWLQLSLDHCAAESGPQYKTCIEAQLAACRTKVAQALTQCQQTGGPLQYPNAPWLPQTRGVSISYSATCGFQPSDASAAANYFFLLPFGGYSPAQSSAAADFSDTSVPMLAIPQAGNLDLGFTDLDAAQTLTLLFQQSAGSTLAPPAVEWRQLVSNTYVPLTEFDVPSDTTNQLQNTGVVTLRLPASCQGGQTVAASGYRWLRAVTQQPELFPDTIGIFPHPLTATWLEAAGGSGEHLASPLPPYTVNTSVQTLAAIKTICQPIESFGGRPREDEKAFQLRMAERLRHKNRAILPWDYEQLVLERYPSVWKVQVLPATGPKGERAPGNVLVAVVAGPGGVQVADPTEPLATSETLEQIREYLAALASPFATIQVVNPVYVRVKVFAQVIFKSGNSQSDPAAPTEDEDAGRQSEQLNHELVQYLSPWFYDAERATLEGDYATEESIAQFIQARPSVAALVRIHLWHDPPVSAVPWYFLTSAKSHTIIPDRSSNCDSPEGE